MQGGLFAVCSGAPSGLVALTPHRARRMNTACAMTERAESVEGMLLAGRLYLHLHGAELVARQLCDHFLALHEINGSCAVR